MSAADNALIAIIAEDTGASRLSFDDLIQVPEVEVGTNAPSKPSLNSILMRYKQYVAELNTTLARQHQVERALFGCTLSRDVEVACIGDVAKHAIELLVQRAKTEFAPAGTTLDISVSDVLESTGHAEWEERFRERYWRRQTKDLLPEVDLDQIWTYLEQTYGGENGRVRGLRQQARLIAKEFRLDDDATIKRTSSHVSCFLRLWSVKQDYGRESGRWHHSEDRRLADLFKAMACFAEHAELDALAIQIAPGRNTLWRWDTYYDLREKHSFDGLEIVIYKEKWEWKLSHEVAEKLMHFLGEFTGD